jgi:mono/diheme cytochrome c family protein
LVTSKRLCTVLAAALWCVVGQSADLEAGKAAAQAKCSQCHAATDWEGEDAASLESLMRDIVANKVKHSKSKLELSAAEMADIAAYWGSGGKGKKSR